MFISIEGIDGSGKTTQAIRLSQWLEDLTGRKTIRTFEPGGWNGGKLFRDFILAHNGFSTLSDLLLFLADRSEHVKRVIIPALTEGHNVICERYNDSTLAYQSGGHKLNISVAESIIAACNFPEPDIKIFLDIEPETAYSRITSRIPDKFEAEGVLFLRNVADFYHSRGNQFMIIDCNNLNEQEIFTAITSKLEVCICQSR